MATSRERLAFACAVLGLYVVFVVQAWNTPVLLDDWYQLTYWRHHDYSLASLWEYGHYNYFHFNPRIGDVFLAVVNGPRIVHLILTPLVQLAVLPTTFALAFARWPKPTLRDLERLLIIQTLIWLVIPIPGLIYFYRPFATNYLWAFTITVTLCLPYRFALAHGSQRRLWLVPIMLPLGWLAGMSNEHTGPTAMLALAVFCYVAWRRGQLRAWMLAGLAGIYIGYPMLFLAPGQAVRYAGLATRDTPLHVIAERGVSGCWAILVDFLGEALPGTLVVVVGALVFLRAIRRRGDVVPALPKVTVMTAFVLLLAAGSIIVTLFASPTATERLFYASGILFVAALIAMIDPLLAERSARRFFVIACGVIFAYHVVRYLQTYVEVKAENDDRIAQLRATQPGTVAHIPAFDHKRRTHWYYGDDFKYASLREYVGNEVFDLAGIELDEHLRWAQPSPPDHYEATRTFDPPLPPDVAARLSPVTYIPTYWEWSIAQLRRMLVTTQLGDFEGHKLVHYIVESRGLGFADPKQRPLVVVDWTPKGFDFVDGRPYDDKAGNPYIRVWQASVPKRLEASYVVACGQTREVHPMPDTEGVGPLLPVSLDCRGNHTAVMCEPDRCWLAGRYWR